MTFENWWEENWSDPFAVGALNEAFKDLAKRAYQAGRDSVLSTPVENEEKMSNTLASTGRKPV